MLRKEDRWRAEQWDEMARQAARKGGGGLVFFLPSSLALPGIGGASSALAQKESRRLAKAE